MRIVRLLLEIVVSFWNTDEEYFIIQGERLEIIVHDVDFFTRLLMLGVIDDTTLKLAHGVTLMIFVRGTAMPLLLCMGGTS